MPANCPGGKGWQVASVKNYTSPIRRGPVPGPEWSGMPRSQQFVDLLFLPSLLTFAAAAQSLGGPGISGPPDSKFTNTRSGTAPFDVSASGLTQLNARMLMWGDQQASPLQNPHLLSSKLDAKAPAKARQAFEKGYE